MMKPELFVELFDRISIDDLRELVCICNSYDGSLESYNVYEFNDEFFNTMYNDNVIEAVKATYFGNINWNDEFIRFNGYGNLESLSDYQYKKELLINAKEIIDTALELYKNKMIDVSQDICDVFDEYLSKLNDYLPSKK